MIMNGRPLKSQSLVWAGVLALATGTSRVLAGLALLGMASVAYAADYPTKPIQVLIPFAPGGGTDNTIRIVEEAASKALGQKLVLVNQPGGHGSRAVTQLKQAAPDGYTIGIVPTGPIASVPHTAEVPYTKDDFAMVIQLTNVPNTLIVPKDSAIKSVKDMVEKARKSPPGTLKVAITGMGSASSHLPMVDVEKQAKIKFTFIPHKGGGPALVPVMGGHVDLGSVDLSVSGPKLKSGDVKAIGIFAEQRSKDFPTIPTMKEQGYDLDAGFFNMIMAPKGTPANVIKRLHDAFKAALADSAVVARAKELNLAIEYLGPEDCRKKVDRYDASIGTLVKELGMGKKKG
jgi:tripartite-type tricarboxylate transporter receptor subunit TctC